jgi:poly(3-hydroxybutyrate) depolymerase
VEYLNALRRRFEATLATARTKAAGTEAVAQRSERLREITNFGTNPGNSLMHAYVPNSVPRMASLVVTLHGCA